ncbi:MAG: hypothetical protein M3245_00840 [Actinomycetota bacterium]|nr:hypothetical protein [Actinomycetota bacterium]
MEKPTKPRGFDALAAGRAFVDLSPRRVVRVTGADARTWLGDLLTADIAGLAPGRATRSFLLAPTGHIRAEVMVACHDDGFLLVQDPAQPHAIDLLLAPYRLSSDVALEDRSDAVAVFAFPGQPAPSGEERHRPSILGEGMEAVVPADRVPAFRERCRQAGLEEAGADAVERWRIEGGVPRFPLDLTPGSLPHEAGLDEAIDRDKGCFLGQEAVARVHNLGHPPFVVLPVRGAGAVRPGDRVVAGGEDVGAVTSATPTDGGGSAAIVRIRWAARGEAMATAAGVALSPAG